MRGPARRTWPLIGTVMVVATIAASNAPAQAASLPSVSSGGAHSCAVKSDSTVVCWGWNDFGQATVPADLGTVKQVRADDFHTCAVRTDSTLTCWGWNNFGGTSVPADIGTVTEVSTGRFNNCAVKTNSTLACWGDSAHGLQLNVPSDLGTVTHVSVGRGHICAIKTDSTLVCWGGNAGGQSSVPSDLGTVTQVSAGDGHTCAIKSDSTLVCWGDAEEDDLGQAIVPANLGPVSEVDMAEGHTCALRTDATVVCWGDNYGGVATVPAGLGRVIQISAGDAHNCVVKASHAIICWGDNSYGETSVPAGAFPSLSGAVIDYGDASGLDFGDVTAGLRSPVLKSALTARPVLAGVPLTVGSASLSNAGGGAFALLSQSCTAGQVLADGASCALRVRFTPKIWQRGDITGQVTVTDDSAAGTRTIPLTGTALPPASFILQNTTATPAAGKVDFNWETSDDSKVTLTIAQPVTTTVKVKQGKKTVTKKVTTVKQLPLTPNLTAPAGPGTFTWNRKITGKPAAKGTWTWVLTAKSSRGTVTRTATVTLG